MFRFASSAGFLLAISAIFVLADVAAAHPKGGKFGGFGGGRSSFSPGYDFVNKIGPGRFYGGGYGYSSKHKHGYHGHRRYYGYAYGYGYPYVYPYYGYSYYGYPYYGSYYGNVIAQPIVVQQPVIGLGGIAAGANFVQQPVQNQQQPVVEEPVAANPAARNLAWRFVSFGDKQFREGDYHAALQRYKKAESASDVATAHFREAFAHYALGKYDRATQAIRAGLAIDSQWPFGNVRLEDLFPNPAAQAAARMELSETLRENPFDSDAHFIQGVLLHFEGQEEQALDHFVETMRLRGAAQHAEAFLQQPPAPAAEAPLGPIAPE